MPTLFRAVEGLADDDADSDNRVRLKQREALKQRPTTPPPQPLATALSILVCAYFYRLRVL
jgi:hypothetical protein